MAANDFVLSVSSVEGFRIDRYLGYVYAESDSQPEMIDEIIKQAKEVEANRVIGFQFTVYPPRYYGSGTAVRLVPIK